MIEPSTDLARKVTTFLQSYPATRIEVLETEFYALRDVMRSTLDELITAGFVQERELEFFATGYWSPDFDLLKPTADALSGA